MKKTVIIFSIIIFIFVLISSITTKIVYDQSFPRFERYDETINAYLRYEELEQTYQRTLATFTSEGNTLQGYTYYQEQSHGLVVIAHGLGGGADSYLAYTKWFLDQGWSVFMYDATGSFDSEGESTKGFPQSLIDLENALEYLKEDTKLNTLDIVLFGHSWGGYAVTNALHFDYDIKAVVSIAAPYEANQMIFEQTKNMMGIFAYTQYPFLQLYQRYLFNEYASYSAIDAINKNDAHVMIVHGINDDTIRYDGSAIIAKRANITNPNVTFITRDSENKDGHNNLMRSTIAVNYIEEINITYRALYDEHDGDIPYAIHQAFYETVDRYLVQQLDDALMQQIHTMYLQALNE